MAGELQEKKKRNGGGADEDICLTMLARVNALLPIIIIISVAAIVMAVIATARTL